MAKSNEFPGKGPDAHLQHLHIHDSPMLSKQAQRFSSTFYDISQRWGQEWAKVHKKEELGEEWAEILTHEELENVYKRLQTNLFEGQLFTLGSFLNHSCLPNAGWH